MPVDASPKARIFHFLQYLAGAGHEITLVAFRRESDKSDYVGKFGRLYS